jgi:hypothetical protein
MVRFGFQKACFQTTPLSGGTFQHLACFNLPNANALATRCVRGVRRTFRPEGVGNAGCPMHPQPRVRMVSKDAHEYSQRRHRKSPGIPARNGFNGVLRDLPGDRAFLPPSPRGLKVLSGPVEPNAASAELDASVEASGPHDLTVRGPPFAQAARRAWYQSRRSLGEGEYSVVVLRGGDRSRGSIRPAILFTPNAAASTASRPAFRDDRDTPLVSRRDVGDVTSDLGVASRKNSENRKL